MTRPSGQPSLNNTADEELTAASPRRVSRITVTRAQLVLYWEQLWPGLLPTLAPLFLLIIASLFGLWRVLPTLVHWLAITAFVATTIWAVRKFIWDIKWPDRREALNRLEDDSHLNHAPLQALEDTPFDGEQNNPFWRAHLDNMRRKARGARLRLSLIHI